MTDFISKIITLILIFIMCVIAPLMISYASTQATCNRLALNETVVFIDTVTNKGYITPEDIRSFNISLNSHGRVFKSTIERQVLVEEPLPDSTTKICYFTEDISDITKEQALNTGDIVKVSVEGVTASDGERLMVAILRVWGGIFQFSHAGVVL